MNKDKLLILDDDPLLGETIVKIAELVGFETFFCTNANDFFEQLDSWHPSHIAIDLILPEKDGVEVLAELAERKCDAYLIVTSGVQTRVLEAAARSASARGLKVLGILPKPFSPSGLRSLLALEPTHQADIFLPADTKSSPVTVEDLADAISSQALYVVYQPKVDCKTGRLEGVEVLSRWRHKDKGLISPEHFISLAEQHKLITPLTKQVFRTALNWFSHFSQEYSDKINSFSQTLLTLSLNVSAVSLGDEELFEFLDAECQKQGVEPHQIILELTETVAMEDTVSSLDRLTRLRMRGFQLSIDDFGTGFSSMLQLVRLPFSEVKIDKAFVITANTSRESRMVIKAVTELAHSLGLRVTAEGIEDIGTLHYLQHLGCELGQGYYISRPLDGDDVLGWVKQRYQTLENKRTKKLHSLRILDTPPEERFDRITKLAKKLFRVPISLISLVDEERQWFKSNQCLPVQETSRTIAFCNQAVSQQKLVVIKDATKDPFYSSNPLVQQAPYIRFYAGCPVAADRGEILGTLCLIDIKPREFDQNEADLLRELAGWVEDEIASDRLISEDHLTGILNRRAFEQHAEHMLKMAARQKLLVSLLYFDLDEFKSLNDELGHDQGDQALAAFADALTDSFRESDLIARLGGDEFAVMLVSDNENQAKSSLKRFKKRLAEKNSTDSAIPLKYSVGIAHSIKESSYTNLRDLYRRADKEMYRQKRRKNQ